MGYATAMWLGFGEALAAVAGALTGLLFVAVSVKSEVLAASRSLSSRAAQTLVLFMTSVLIAVLLVAPQPPAAFGSELLAVARTVGLTPASLRKVMYELPLPASGERPRQVEPCPMSSREVDVLRRLARGMVYKQIANELGLSTSTIRTHLHNVYGKLGAMDRAQAVLIATERGWI